MSSFQPVVGSLHRSGAPRQVASYSLGRQMANERSFHAEGLAMGGMAGALIIMPSMVVLSATLPLAILATPAVLGLGAVALASTVGLGVFGAIKGHLEAKKAQGLDKRQKHFEAGGNEKSFNEQLKADGVGMLGRLMSSRAAKQAEKDVFKNQARGFNV